MIQNKIGAGNSSQVFKGLFNNSQVAIKKITINNTDVEHLKEIKREIVSLAKITPHKNLIVLKGLTYY